MKKHFVFLATAAAAMCAGCASDNVMTAPVRAATAVLRLPLAVGDAAFNKEGRTFGDDMKAIGHAMKCGDKGEYCGQSNRSVNEITGNGKIGELDVQIMARDVLASYRDVGFGHATQRVDLYGGQAAREHYLPEIRQLLQADLRQLGGLMTAADREVFMDILARENGDGDRTSWQKWAEEDAHFINQPLPADDVDNLKADLEVARNLVGGTDLDLESWVEFEKTGAAIETRKRLDANGYKWINVEGGKAGDTMYIAKRLTWVQYRLQQFSRSQQNENGLVGG